MRLLFWLAILPSALLAARVLAYDRIEHEPVGLLIKIFIAGALSCIPAAIIETLGEMGIASVTDNRGLMAVLTYLLLVPIAEEGVKFAALNRVHHNPNFNYTFDGIVYGVMAALGFATLENVLYVLDNMSIEVALMRGVLSVPLHCTCGVFMGYYYGVARGQEVRGVPSEARRARKMAMLIPCIIHGVYDYSLATESASMLVGGLIFTVFVFWMGARQVRVASANDAPIMVSLEGLTKPLPHEGFGLSSLVRGDGHRGTPPPPFNG